MPTFRSGNIAYDLINDTSPQLGGDLDVNGHSLLNLGAVSVTSLTTGDLTSTGTATFHQITTLGDVFGGTLSNITLEDSDIDNTPIGLTAASTGAFTTLTASTSFSSPDYNNTTWDSTSSTVSAKEANWDAAYGLTTSIDGGTY